MDTKKYIDIGTKFGMLTVVGPGDPLPTKRGDKRATTRCVCDCGKTKDTRNDALISGASRSCGCGIAAAGKKRIKHGESRRSVTSPEYTAWQNMIRRCADRKSAIRTDYLKKGRFVCDGLSSSCNSFMEILGRRPSPKHSVDREDNNRSYTCGRCEQCLSSGYPLNVRWATREVQDSNTSKNVFIEYDGRKMTLSQLSRHLGLAKETVRTRILRGLPPDKRISRKKAKDIEHAV